MGMIKEFKEFAVKGNALDMAVGIIIGAAFGTIVKSLVADVIMPPIGLLLGNVDFSNLFVVLKQGADVAAPYATMADADLIRMSEHIPKIMNDDAVLFSWATAPRLPFAIDLLKKWGFSYKTIGFTWVKTNPKKGNYFMAMGNWTRTNPEICLLGVRGSIKRNPLATKVEQLVVAPRGKHSSKPLEVRERIVELMGDIPRLELFARSCGEGWDATGLEYDGMDVFDFLKMKTG